MASKTETLGGRYAGIYKRGSTFSYVVRDSSGKQRWRGGFKSPSAAMRDRDRTRSDIARGDYVAPNKQRFEEFSAEWLEARRSRLRPSTLASYADLLRDHVNPRIGHIRLPNPTAAHLDALYAELFTDGRRDGTGGLSARTVRYTHTVIRAALQTAFRWGRVTRNEADRAEPPVATRTEPPTGRQTICGGSWPTSKATDWPPLSARGADGTAARGGPRTPLDRPRPPGTNPQGRADSRDG